MVVGKIHVGDILTDFQVVVYDTDVNDATSVLDVSTCTAKYIIITDPDGNETQFTASFLTTGTDGIIRYINSNAAFLDEGGVWKYHGRVIFPDTGDFSTNPALFEVLD